MNRLAVLLVALFSALAVSQPAWAQGGHGADATRGVVWAEDFEAAPTGALHRLETSVGTWSAPEGQATVHGEHRRSGARSLRLLGGEDRRVELQLPEISDKALELSFWAERWTARGPFVFRVLGEVDGQWQELYNGDERIKVGGFDTLVRVALPAGVQKLRMVSTSPAGSGVMLDDLRVHEPVPMQIESITTEQPVYPALIGNRTNPIARVVIRTTGSLEPITVKTLRINTRGTTNLGDIEAVEVYYTGGQGTLSNDYPDANFPESAGFGSAQSPRETLRFRGRQTLIEGVNYFWVSYRLKDSANIDHRLDAGCEAVGFVGSQGTIEPEIISPEGSQRMGVALRNADDDGIRAYRIPGLATTNEGTLIAVYDNRNRGWGDLPGDIDVGMSLSTDGGRTWEPMQTIMDMGDDPAFRYDGIGDPAVLVDRETNTIWVAATWSHGNRSWHGSQPGLEPEETGQFILVKSEDDGKTWSEPINITRQIKDPSWCFLLPGPGKGITLSDGTIMFAAQYQDTPENRRLPRSTVVYSKDHGRTWEIGTGAFDDTTEAQVVELDDGQLMLNCRYNRASRRVVTTSDDLGQTWTEHSTSREALTEPGTCMASLINVDRELGREYQGLLLFSNPASLTSRSEMTIRASADGGLTWPDVATVMLDQGQSAGYSCMTMIDHETVGILYEGNRAHMTFQRVPLKDLTEALNRGE
jgi:sialidase-1